MDVVSKAYDFAVLAYAGCYRKAEREKPSVFHAIDVANKLKSYGFDDNVVAAGYLHDIIEDTSYTEEDLLKLFGRDITSLVVGATEEDRSLSWEDRKNASIVRVKNLDLRHKAVVVCDKISNIEDLRFKFGRDGIVDFSSFNRGKDKKIWYWKEMYNSLISGEDCLLPMFVKLKSNIDDIDNFFNVLNNSYYPDMDVIDHSYDFSNIARQLYYKKCEVNKILSLMKNKQNVVVEIVSNNDCNKSNIINKIKTYFILNNFNVLVLNNGNYNEDVFNNYDLVLLNNSYYNDIVNLYSSLKKGKNEYGNLRQYIRKNKNSFDNIDIICLFIDDDDYLYNMVIKKYIKGYITEGSFVCEANYDISEKLIYICSCILDVIKMKNLNVVRADYVVKRTLKKIL